MAKSARVDDVIVADGTVAVKYTQGDYPLPAEWQGEGLTFHSHEAMVAALADVEERFSGQDLVLLQLAVALKKDPSLKAGFLSAAKGKTATVDLTGLAAAISLG